MPEYISFLPHVNAILNSTSALLLLAGFSFSSSSRIQSHRNCQLAAVVTSSLFLISYPDLSLLPRRDAICRTGACPSRIFHNSDNPHDSRGRSAAADPGNALPRRAREIRQAPRHRALDAAAVAFTFL